MSQTVCTALLDSFHELIVTGRDRAKFLHNFCTNNIKSAAVNSAREAFFTDVKARVLAHGYIIVGEAEHRILMIGGDPGRLLQHLDRYIITEDVTVSVNACVTNAVAAWGQGAVELCGRTLSDQCVLAAVNGACFVDIDGQVVAVLGLKWNNVPLVLAGADQATAQKLLQQLADSGANPADADAFESLRIYERFPIVARDIGENNLAPEADRNESAVSFAKGCYLGQEPIARIDSMGHVNRSLRTIAIDGPSDVVTGGELRNAEGMVAGTVTSTAAVIAGKSCIAMGVFQNTAIAGDSALHVVTGDGQQFPVRLA